jgi:quaternary ammonium compound-resistance protein SugE
VRHAAAFDLRSQSFAMAWGILLVAAVSETGWAVGLKYTNGFTRFWPTRVDRRGAGFLSVALLTFAVRSLPIALPNGWTGAASTALFGVWLFMGPRRQGGYCASASSSRESRIEVGQLRTERCST